MLDCYRNSGYLDTPPRRVTVWKDLPSHGHEGSEGRQGLSTAEAALHNCFLVSFKASVRRRRSPVHYGGCWKLHTDVSSSAGCDTGGRGLSSINTKGIRTSGPGPAVPRLDSHRVTFYEQQLPITTIFTSPSTTHTKYLSHFRKMSF